MNKTLRKRKTTLSFKLKFLTNQNMKYNYEINNNCTLNYVAQFHRCQQNHQLDQCWENQGDGGGH